MSEPESIALDSYVNATNNIKAAVSVHSFGNVLIFPWGYTETPHPKKVWDSLIDLKAAIILNSTEIPNIYLGCVLHLALKILQ